MISVRVQPGLAATKMIFIYLRCGIWPLLLSLSLKRGHPNDQCACTAWTSCDQNDMYLLVLWHLAFGVEPLAEAWASN
eukprot:6212493-Pleurochrysis_carterae.AAC.2